MVGRTYTLGISRREFARRDGCTETRVRQAIAEGRLSVLADDSLDPALAGTAWRKGNTKRDASPADAGKRERKRRIHAKPPTLHAKSGEG